MTADQALQGFEHGRESKKPLHRGLDSVSAGIMGGVADGRPLATAKTQLSQALRAGATQVCGTHCVTGRPSSQRMLAAGLCGGGHLHPTRIQHLPIKGRLDGVNHALSRLDRCPRDAGCEASRDHRFRESNLLR